MKNNDNIFNEKNFLIFLEDNKEKNMKLLEDSISFEKIKSVNENKDLNPSFDLYEIDKFQNVIFHREEIINNKMKLLINKEKKSDIEIDNYKKIYLKVNKIKNNFYFDEVRKQREEIFIIQSYRKIKNIC